MRVSAINGYQIDEYGQPVGNIFRRAGNWVGEKAKAVVQTGRQVIQTVTKPIIKVAAVAPRLAFLGLIRMNVRGMASDLERALQRKDLQDRLFKVWSGFGGSNSELTRVIQLGAKQKRVFGAFGFEVPGIAAEPATTTAAAITAAAPIIAKVVPILVIIAKELNKKEPEANLPAALQAQAASSGIANQYEIPVDFPAETSAAGKAALERANDAMPATMRQSAGGAMSVNPALLIGGVLILGGAVYMSNKKKRR